MDWNMVLGAAYWIAMILLGGLALLFQGSATLRGKATALIAQAEETFQDSTQSGGVKFEWVVTQLYALLPAPLHMIVTRAMVERLVQATFDSIEAYAKLQLKRLTDGKDGGSRT